MARGSCSKAFGDLCVIVPGFGILVNLHGRFLTYITKNVDCHAIMYSIQNVSLMLSMLYCLDPSPLSTPVSVLSEIESVRRYLLTRSPSNVDQVPPATPLPNPMIDISPPLRCISS
jgi:hypothetical protein